MAIVGSGITWLPEICVREAVAEGKLVQIGGSKMTIEIQICLFRRSGHQSALIEAFWQELVRQQTSPPARLPIMPRRSPRADHRASRRKAALTSPHRPRPGPLTTTGRCARIGLTRQIRTRMVSEQRGTIDTDESVVLSVESLRVSFRLSRNETLEAVRDVSFQIRRGETLALVGESGSGKSVTAMTVMRLTEHDGARIDGGRVRMRMKTGKIEDLTTLPARRIEALRGSEISIVFQDPMSSLNPVFRVGEQIAEGIIRHQGKTEAEALAIALSMLKLVRVPDAERRMRHYPHQLSGGMRQRVMIAMALACRPSLMILDEPTTALDVTIQAQILDLVRALQKDIGMAALFITHDMGVVAEIADRVCVMLEGEIVESGTVHAIFERPGHRYTQALIAAVPRLGSMADKDMPEKFPLVVYHARESAA
jgi:ABC-type dipeptide/oligopeptide/nickel transport system ATPase component